MDLLFRLSNRILSVPVRLSAAAFGVPTVRLPVVETDKQLYLTFDDGPTETHTAEILRILGSFRATATFFVTTSRLAAFRELAIEAKAGGHDVASHGHTHQDPWFQSSRKAIDDFNRSVDVLTEMGLQPAWYRAPYGHFRPAHLRAAQERGVRLAGWSVMPGDFRSTATAARVFNTIQTAARPGGIVVLHDNESVAARRVTLDGLRTVLDYYSAAGWVLTALPHS